MYNLLKYCYKSTRLHGVAPIMHGDPDPAPTAGARPQQGVCRRKTLFTATICRSAGGPGGWLPTTAGVSLPKWPEMLNAAVVR
jgi:hypothetical protein